MLTTAFKKVFALAFLLTLLGLDSTYAKKKKKQEQPILSKDKLAELSKLPANQNIPGPRCRPPILSESTNLVEAKEMFDGQIFERPVQLLEDPRRKKTWFVVENRGQIFKYNQKGKRQLFFDLSKDVFMGKQWGLQEIALHPNFPKDPRVFVAYVLKHKAKKKESIGRVSSFRLAKNRKTLDRSSEKILLEDHSKSMWHPIAGLKFGPDGYLYIAFGLGSKESPASYRGKMLRIDINEVDPKSKKHYRIPKDNPYTKSKKYPPEVWASGFRNPWRFSFDSKTKKLWLGDVGERSFEEVNVVESGKDYGWPIWEGPTCRKPKDCKKKEFAPPAYSHSHAEMSSISGGIVYRGRKFPELFEHFIYAAYNYGTIYALPIALNSKPKAIFKSPEIKNLATFTQGLDKELYFTTVAEYGSNNKVYKLVPPKRKKIRKKLNPSLSSTGCLSPPGVSPLGHSPYSIVYPAWNDGAKVFRSMPSKASAKQTIYGDQTYVAMNPQNPLIKTFAVDGKPVETQILTRKPDGGWDGLDYEWNAQGTDATLVNESKTVTLANGKKWRFPGSNNCFSCHNTDQLVNPSLAIGQLHYRTKVNGKEISQLETMARKGFFKFGEHWKQRNVTQLHQNGFDKPNLTKNARSYLHANCAHCHNAHGTANQFDFSLDASLSFEKMGVCNTPAVNQGLAPKSLKVLTPGKPKNSLLWLRITAPAGPLAMPPDRQAIDKVGSKLIADWIKSIPGCGTKRKLSK